MALIPGTKSNGLLDAAQRRLEGVASAGGEGAAPGGSGTPLTGAQLSPFAGALSQMTANGQGAMPGAGSPVAADSGGVATQIPSTPPSANVNPALPSSRDYKYDEALDPVAPTFTYNDKYAALDVANRNDIIGAQNARRTGWAQADADYDLAVNSADMTQKSAKQRLMDRLASQGIAGSSQALEAMGEMDSSFKNYLTGLTNQWTGTKGRYNQDYSSAINRVSGNRNQMWQDQTDEQAAAEAARAKEEADAIAAQKAADDARAQAQADRDAIIASNNARNAAPAVAPPNPNVYGTGVWDAGGNQQMTDANGLLGRINNQTTFADREWLRNVGMDQALPQNIKEAIANRLQALTGTPDFNPSQALPMKGRAY